MPATWTRGIGLLVPRSTFSATLPNTPPVSGDGYGIDLVHLCVVGDLRTVQGHYYLPIHEPSFIRMRDLVQEEQTFSCKKLESLISL